jgi:hypothetical protein
MHHKSLSRSIHLHCAHVAALSLAIAIPAAAQTSRWADPNEPTAKELIALEHQWTDTDCAFSNIMDTLLADDFQGVSPEGKPYSKQVAIAESKSQKVKARACQTYEVKVHFFGENLAILYGSESAIWMNPDGTEYTRKLTWVDTWLKRNGNWQIIAAEDLPQVLK